MFVGFVGDFVVRQALLLARWRGIQFLLARWSRPIHVVLTGCNTIRSATLQCATCVMTHDVMLYGLQPCNVQRVS